MADQSRAKQREAEAAQATSESGSGDEDRYTAAEWRERSAAQLRVSPHVISGAFAGLDASKKLTEAQVRRRIEEFLDREVEVA